MKKCSIMTVAVLIFLLTLAGCGGGSGSGSGSGGGSGSGSGGGSGSGSGSGGGNHTHATSDKAEGQITKFLSDISAYNIDAILNNSFLENNSFTLQFFDEHGLVIQEKTKDYHTLAKQLIDDKENQINWRKVNSFKVELVKNPETGKDLISAEPKPDEDNYLIIDYLLIVKVTESKSVPRKGPICITMKNYNNQNQWVCSSMKISKDLSNDTSGFGLHTFSGN